MPPYKVKKHVYGPEEELPLNRNLHAYKYETFLGINDPNRKPIINPPEDKQVELSSTSLQQMGEIDKGLLDS